MMCLFCIANKYLVNGVGLLKIDNMRLALFIIISLLIVSCSLFPNEQGQVDLFLLSFTRSELFTEPFNAYEVGEPIVLTANVYPSELGNAYPQVEVTTTSGNSTVIGLATLHEISSRQLAGAIQDHAGKALVVIKEEDKDRAYTPGVGYTTSLSTMEKMHVWLSSMEGIEITEKIPSAPIYALEMSPNSGLVDKIRNHKNVEILEPQFKWFRIAKVNSSSKSQNFQAQVNEDPIGLMGVLFTSGNGSNGFHIQPGDTLIARYRLPDGNTLEARTTVK